MAKPEVAIHHHSVKRMLANILFNILLSFLIIKNNDFLFHLLCWI